MADLGYCRHCSETIDYDVDFFHYHEPINTRCSVCGSKCYGNLCRGCSSGLTDVQREEREMVGTRVKKNTDDD